MIDAQKLGMFGVWLLAAGPETMLIGFAVGWFICDIRHEVRFRRWRNRMGFK